MLYSGGSRVVFANQQKRHSRRRHPLRQTTREQTQQERKTEKQATKIYATRPLFGLSFVTRWTVAMANEPSLRPNKNDKKTPSYRYQEEQEQPRLLGSRPTRTVATLVILVVALGILDSVHAQVELVGQRTLPNVDVAAATTDNDQSAGSSFVMLSVLVLFCALLNTLSHLAVVSGFLRHDTYVLSILIGVGFDVVSQIMYATWWWCWSSSSLSSTRSTATTVPINETIHDMDSTGNMEQYGWLFMTVPSAMTLTTTLVVLLILLTNLYLHLRALFIASSSSLSLKRLQSVVQSAWNNLRGDPGPMFADHAFAYTDLATHVFQLVTVWRKGIVPSFGWNQNTGPTCLLISVVVGIVLVGILLALQKRWTDQAEPIQDKDAKLESMRRIARAKSLLSVQVPSERSSTATTTGNGTTPKTKDSSSSMMLSCRCPVCRPKDGHQTNDNDGTVATATNTTTRAFTVKTSFSGGNNKNNMLCELWFLSFREMANVLDSLEKDD